MSVGFEVRRSDFIWMYLGSWGLPIALAPGLLLIVIGLSGIVPMFLGLPRDPTIPFANYLFLGAVGLAALVAGPAYLCFLLAKGDGIDRVVGRTVSLRIDDAGVWGWPLAKEIDTSWEHVRRARSLGGVIALPFRKFATREGWVPIPERALTPGQRRDLWVLLAAKRLAKPPKL